MAGKGGAGQVRTCGGRRGRRRVSRRCAQVRAEASGALCSTALAEDQDQEITEGDRQAPGPPLPPRDEPLAQTGPERFVRSARVRQGRPLSTSPGARPDRHAGTCRRHRHRHRHHTGGRGCAPLKWRSGSHPAPPALPCPARSFWAARLHSAS
ncbi:uncharacterized protein LOC108581418 [Papio anubis]|uniref:uncharacterized protein LOC108581418 n=1 Tax=Papio anubis TaxID=9555 RepID=UPI00083F1C12|nr:uncharacterized protein LOC108581418 [Papio anubis]